MNKIKLILKALILAFIFFWISLTTISVISINMIDMNDELIVCTMAVLFCISFCTLLIIDNLNKRD